MNLDTLTRKSRSLFDTVGGWRTAAEAVASRVLFLIGYLLTGRLSISVLIAAGGVLVFAVVRIYADRKYLSAAIGLVVVGVSALLASSTGHPVDFYLDSVLVEVVAGTVCLASMVVRWPIVGLVVGARGFGWRRDRRQRRLYQRCTAVFVVKFAIAATVLVPLYLARQLTPLGIASALLQAPAAGICIYLCRRILRT